MIYKKYLFSHSDGQNIFLIYIYLVFVQDFWFIAAKTPKISYDKSNKDIFCYIVMLIR